MSSQPRSGSRLLQNSSTDYRDQLTVNILDVPQPTQTVLNLSDRVMFSLLEAPLFCLAVLSRP